MNASLDISNSAKTPEQMMQSLEVIMSSNEYQLVQSEYAEAEMAQKKLSYRIRKLLSENMITKYICCCLKVKEKVNLEWSEMSPI